MEARVHRGRINDHIEVSDTFTVVRFLRGGAHVRPEATRRVDGDLHGPLVIEPEGTVVVDGAVTGEVINRGYLMVAGHLAATIRQDSGVIAVAAGSFVTACGGRSARVDAGGQLHGADRLGLPVDGRSYLRRVDADHYEPFPGRR